MEFYLLINDSKYGYDAQQETSLRIYPLPLAYRIPSERGSRPATL